MEVEGVTLEQLAQLAALNAKLNVNQSLADALDEMEGWGEDW